MKNLSSSLALLFLFLTAGSVSMQAQQQIITQNGAAQLTDVSFSLQDYHVEGSSAVFSYTLSTSDAHLNDYLDDLEGMLLTRSMITSLEVNRINNTVTLKADQADAHSQNFASELARELNSYLENRAKMVNTGAITREMLRAQDAALQQNQSTK